MSIVEIYHGSDHIIQEPQLGLGNAKNDYGPGFYCTTDKAMAYEWACKNNCNGFVYAYKLDTAKLRTLNLMDDNHHVLHWIALLLNNRTFSTNSEIAQTARDFILKHYLESVEKYDLVYGYRADDSYFAFAEAFVENGLSVRQLERALYLGKLGTQTVLVSQKAFEHIEFVVATPAEKAIYFPKFKQRDTAARETYHNTIKNAGTILDDVFVIDLMRQVK